MQAVPFEITRDPVGVATATNGTAVLRCEEPDAQVFRRRAVKKQPGGASQQCEWVVARVQDVNVYFDGRNLIVSRRDLSP